jgi:hypothetical protein
MTCMTHLFAAALFNGCASKVAGGLNDGVGESHGVGFRGWDWN